MSLKRPSDGSSDEEAPTKRLKLLETKQGYRLLPLQLHNSPFFKYVYFRKHNEKGDEDERVIVVLNLGPGASEEDVRSIFSICGPIVSVELENTNAPKPQPGAPSSELASEATKLAPPVPYLQTSSASTVMARITFQTSEGAKAAKKARMEDFLGKVEPPGKRGLEKWLGEYKQKTNVDAEDLQKKIDLFMCEFDKKEEEHKQKLIELASVPDPDGWIQVTRTGKRNHSIASGKSFHVASMSQAELLARKAREKKQEKQDFYKFQRMEAKKKSITELRERFELDKKRIEKMKQHRKFKAF